ncbi:MAG TPA: hypothetical protein VGN14_05765 [Candidatus Elarobacter sp.]|jgi:hypothetical protein
MKRAFAVVGVGLVVAAAALGFVLASQSCTDVFPVHEAPEVLRVEAEEFQQAASTAFAEHVGDTGMAVGPLSRPIRVVSITGKTATLQVAREIDPGNREYAAVWRDVYRRHHQDRNACVHLRLAWDAKTITQQCCRADL